MRRGEWSGEYEVVRSQLMPPRPVPETDEQRKAREARGLPPPVFAFVVESVREIRAHQGGKFEFQPGE